MKSNLDAMAVGLYPMTFFLQKKFRRLRKISDDEDSDDGSGKDFEKVDDRDAIANELFQGYDDEEPLRVRLLEQ